MEKVQLASRRASAPHSHRRRRTIAQATGIVEAARRLLRDKGRDFTTQELAREAGVALQTFYRHFPSKDHLLAAVIEEEIAENAERMATAARDLPDPVARLRSYVETTLATIQGDAAGATDPARILGARFITAEHWRLRQRLPEDMDRAIQPMIDLIGREVAAARAAGLLRPRLGAVGRRPPPPRGRPAAPLPGAAARGRRRRALVRRRPGGHPPRRRRRFLPLGHHPQGQPGDHDGAADQDRHRRRRLGLPGSHARRPGLTTTPAARPGER
jgi:AcrR family transcriptional regulator